jgi:hypothetical protein
VRALGPTDLLGECASLFFERCTIHVPLLGSRVDRLADDVAAAVERCELTDDGGFEFALHYPLHDRGLPARGGGGRVLVREPGVERLDR